ncbi:MAG: NAD(P)/FAD-dependent oxidoreductase [Patulibacter sp.]
MSAATATPPATSTLPIPSEVRVAIVGSGFSGMGVAIGLLDDGERDFVMLETASDLGGTWRDNTYPGCACDVPSHMYSFSFAPNPDWSRSFASQPEIWRYQLDVAERYGLRDYLRTDAEVLGATWDAAAQRWTVETARGTVRAQFLVSGTGPLCEPRYPEIPGMDSFEGTAFHSARWDHDYDLKGKRVAVIGTGASAIQFVPAIQPDVAKLTLFQRTPAWVLPRPDRPISTAERFAFRHVPFATRAARLSIYVRNELFLLPFRYVRAMRRLPHRIGLQHLERQVQDPVLREKLTPTYDVGCKRTLLSNSYLKSLDQPNADVITSGIREIRANAVVDQDGVEHEVDAIIYGTGFHVTDQPIADRVRGNDGLLLAEKWAPGMEAHKGTTVPGFPNLFMMVGPNTGLGHNSIIYMIESQVHYLLQTLRTAHHQRIGALEPRQDVVDAENEAIQKRLQGTVWNDGGCASWYLDDRGRNTTLWPDFTFLYRRELRTFDPAEHVLTPAVEQAEPVLAEATPV